MNKKGLIKIHVWSTFQYGVKSKTSYTQAEMVKKLKAMEIWLWRRIMKIPWTVKGRMKQHWRWWQWRVDEHGERKTTKLFRSYNERRTGKLYYDWNGGGKQKGKNKNKFLKIYK